jgi:S1-C subfamily serine protease
MRIWVVRGRSASGDLTPAEEVDRGSSASARDDQWIPALAAIDPAQGGSPGGPAPGFGFAIPGQVAADLAAQIVRSGHVTDSHRAALGVGVPGLVDASGNPVGVGVVGVTPGGAAAAAGIRAGDVITALAGKPTPSPSALSEVLAGLSVGQHVALTVQTPGAPSRQVPVTLGELST